MNERGRWITVNGRHIFLRPGESVESHFGDGRKLQKSVPLSRQHSITDKKHSLLMARRKTDHVKKRQRKEERNISDKAIESVVKNPLHSTKPEIDEKGRRSVRDIGRSVTVIRNPDNGVIITVIRTPATIRKKYEKKSIHP